MGFLAKYFDSKSVILGKNNTSQKDYDDLMAAHEAKRSFVRFSQAHQGVYQYITQKNKIEKKTKEEALKEHERKMQRTLRLRPQTR